ncbi:hypothetical protein ACVWZK_000217 [Bradyrhizobium sp. GM0.4]
MTDDRTFARIEALFDIKSFSDIKVLIAGCGLWRKQRRASACDVGG